MRGLSFVRLFAWMQDQIELLQSAMADAQDEVTKLREECVQAEREAAKHAHALLEVRPLFLVPGCCWCG